VRDELACGKFPVPPCRGASGLHQVDRGYPSCEAKEAVVVTTLARRERGTFADLMDWMETEFPAFPIFRPFAGQMMRVEEFADEGQYVLRLELPGIDPDKDVVIAIEGGLLTVKAERREEKRDSGHSEFRYGTFTRTLRLPAGTVEDEVSASYHDGILEIRAPIAEAKTPTAKHISVVKS
jgi:HSP20 family protein